MQQVDECIAVRQYIKAWTGRSKDIEVQIDGPKLLVSNILDYSVMDAVKELRKYKSIRCILYSYSFGCMPQGDDYESAEGREFQSFCGLLFMEGQMAVNKGQLAKMLTQLYEEFKVTAGFEEYIEQVEEIFESIKDVPDAKMLGSAILLINRDGSNWDLREGAPLGERVVDSVLGKVGSAQATAMSIFDGTDSLEYTKTGCDNGAAVVRAVNSEEWAEMSEALNSIGCWCENVKPHELEVHLQDHKQVSDATAILNNYNVRYELLLFTANSFRADNTDESLMVSAKILPGMTVDKAIQRLKSIRIEDREAARELANHIMLSKSNNSCYSDDKLVPMLRVYVDKEEDAASLEESTIVRVLDWAKKNHIEANVYLGFVVLSPLALLASNVAEYAEGLQRLIPDIRVIYNRATLCGRLLSEQSAEVLQSSGVKEGMQAASLCKEWLATLQKYDGGPSPKSTWVFKELLMNCKKMSIWNSKLWSLKGLLQIHNNRLCYNSVVICHARRRNINPFAIPADMGVNRSGHMARFQRNELQGMPNRWYGEANYTPVDERLSSTWDIWN